MIKLALKRVKAKGYEKHLLDDVTQGEEENLKFHCISKVKVHAHSEVGLFGRPGLIQGLKTAIQSAVGRDIRILMVVENGEGKKLVIVFRETDLDDLIKKMGEADFFKDANFDAGFATNSGFGVVTIDQSSVVRDTETDSRFFIRPVNSKRLYKKYFDVNFDKFPDDGPAERRAREEAKAYFNSIATAASDA